MDPIGSPPAYRPSASQYSLDDRKTATFDQVATRFIKSTETPQIFYAVLDAFREFMFSEESTKISRNQLGVLRALSVLVLEIGAQSDLDGEEISEILSRTVETLQSISVDIKSNELWKYALQNPSLASYLDSKIRAAAESLEAQLKALLRGKEAETTAYKDELVKAQEIDRKKIEELEAIVQAENQPDGNLNAIIKQSMEENLKIIRDPTVQHKQVEAKRALAILAELTGASLPPSTLLGKDFVTIGPHSIHSSATFEVFRGQYFTGEEIAIKQLRHRVDEETAKRTHERFARQALIWSSLRHDAILPFYGIGVADSPVVKGEVQLYMVSPYLQNQDIRRYLKKYPHASRHARLQMVFDVARGLAHMHEAPELPEPGNGVVHSALNIFNILVKDSGRAVISGFGHSKIIRDFHENFTGDNSEYRYMAPEMMLDDAKIMHGTDVWSWAMTALEILTDVPPFGEKTKGPRLVTLLAQQRRPERHNHPKLEGYQSADELWNLFTECWDEVPTARPSADDVVERVKPILKELGKKDQVVVQPKDSSGPYAKATQAGRAALPTHSGQPPPPPEANQLGKATKPTVPGNPPEQPANVPGRQELGKASPAVVPGQAPDRP